MTFGPRPSSHHGDSRTRGALKWASQGCHRGRRGHYRHRARGAPGNPGARERVDGEGACQERRPVEARARSPARRRPTPSAQPMMHEIQLKGVDSLTRPLIFAERMALDECSA